MNKKELRKYIRDTKRKHSDDILARMSEQVIGRLARHPLFQKAQVVCLYSSLPDEVATHHLLDDIRDTKRVLLPTVVGDDMEFHEYTSTSVVVKSDYGIMESQGPLYTDYSKIDLVVVPGMAFDKEGNRLGRGRGYYDKFLTKVDAHKVGVCFPFQLVDHVPHDEHDIRMDEVITL